MKLYRFIATDTQTAIMSAHESLGSEALIYSTQRTPEGIEVLAGLAEKDDTLVKKSKTQPVEIDNLPPPPKVKSPSIEARVIESFKAQLQNTNEKIQQLTETIEALHQVVMISTQKRQWFRIAMNKIGSLLISLSNLMMKAGSLLSKWSPKQLKEGLYGRKRII